MKIKVNKVLTAKQQWVLWSYEHSDWKYLINYGAVRSGKTFIDNILFLAELQRIAIEAKKNNDKRPMYILAGYSSNSIQNNVIGELRNSLGLDPKIDRHGHYHIFGVDVVPTYTGNIRGASAIRGMTSYGAYINEASLATQEAFQEIVQRCSKPGARIICDTNPDNPQHWLKTDYIDNHDPAAKVKTFHFILDDNTFLPEEYRSSLKAMTPSGMYYDRAVLGLWVTGEGAVYKDFDERKMVVNDVPKMVRYIAGIDWGYNHPCSITVFGVDSQNNYYLVDEKTERFKEIDYWTEVARKLQKKYGYKMPFYCDTARTEFIDHFKHNGINALYGWKLVVPGIEIVAGLMKSGRFFVQKGHTQKFMEEIYNYQWDDKAEDKPVKEMDHVMDSMRYCLATPIHEQEQKSYYPTNDKQTITKGLRRFGL